MKRAKPLTRVCIVCLRDFQAWRSDARTCSDACRSALSRSPDGQAARIKKIGQSLKKEIRKKTHLPLKKGIKKVQEEARRREAYPPGFEVSFRRGKAIIERPRDIEAQGID